MADTDLLTEGEALEAANVQQGSQQASRVARLNTAVSDKIDALCGPVVHRTVTDEAHDGGDVEIVPRLRPVVSVTSVVEWSAGTSTTLTAETLSSFPADSYRLLDAGTHSASVARRSHGGPARFAHGVENVLVTYVAGRYENTESVGQAWKQVAAEILHQQWKQSAGSWARSQSVPFDPDVELEGYLSIDDMVLRRLRHEIPVM